MRVLKGTNRVFLEKLKSGSNMAEKENKTRNERYSKFSLSPLMVNGQIINSLHQNGKGPDIDIPEMTKIMENTVEQVKKGDLSSLEEMLTCQAYSLQSLYMNMTSIGAHTNNINHIELLTRLALKAQNQCRTTIATLSEMKNPKRTTFVKQTNQANQMQVNNEFDSEKLKKNSKPANEQLENKHGERLDTRATQEASRFDKTMEAVGTINRGKNN